MASYLKNLEELKDKYQDNIVSLLIGTGFSLNAYKAMPMWDILLLDMAKALYSPTTSEDDLRAFIRKDPTLIVSKFLEANERFKLDNYIEQRIPFFDNDLHAWVAPRTGTAPINKAILHDNDLYLHYHLLNGEWRNIFTTNYDNLLELASERKNSHYKIVTNSQGLLGTANYRHIIKLHGDIWNPLRTDDYDFSFDGQQGMRYVISKADYDQYRDIHEELHNKISSELLGGSLCLIGFSGDDPNFKRWRDRLKYVIDKNTKDDDKSSNTAIYLIDVDSDEKESSVIMNHSSYHIRDIFLNAPEVRKALKLTPQETDKKYMLARLLDYLYETDKQQQEYYLRPMSYRDLWMKSLTWGKPKAEVNYVVLDDILAKKKENRIIQDSYWQEQLLDRIYTKDAYTPQDIDYIFCALQDTLFLPGQYQGMNKRLATAEFTPQQQYIYQQMNHREETLFNPAKDIIASDDAATYEKILRSLFILELDKATALLNEWAPSGLYTIKKALFMCLLGLKPNINQVESEKRLQTD